MGSARKFNQAEVDTTNSFLNCCDNSSYVTFGLAGFCGRAITRQYFTQGPFNSSRGVCNDLHLLFVLAKYSAAKDDLQSITYMMVHFRDDPQIFKRLRVTLLFVSEYHE